jgi:L-lactate dehydrogenase complex protein LldF
MSDRAPHAAAAREFLAVDVEAKRHAAAVFDVRRRRDVAADSLPEWEALRRAAEARKRFALDHLADLLERFEANATAAGAIVHYARDAAELRTVVHGLLAARGVTRVVKSKSMLTEECGLNPYLAASGIEVIDTDLGERIVQLRDEPPSHIVMPAIHLSRSRIGELFHRALGTARGETDPGELVAAARVHLRKHFLAADAAITGVNFAVAESGALVVVTNEGNADLGTALPPLHVACMGLEKIVATHADLGIFLRLLARSATGQPITAYTSFFRGPRPDGELHVVIVDDGRSALLADEVHRAALRCIRCGACLNTCPVYRRSGGHAYDVPVAGPIGSVLAPLRDRGKHDDLPHACTLCGSCSAVCPTRIDLHHQLLALRGAAVAAGRGGAGERIAFELAAAGARSERGHRLLGALARLALPLVGGMTRRREPPRLPQRSFRELWRARERGR